MSEQLIQAAQTGDLETVRQLMQGFVTGDAVHGAIREAVMARQSEVVSYFAAEPAASEILEGSVLRGRKETVRFMLEAGVKPVPSRSSPLWPSLLPYVFSCAPQPDALEIFRLLVEHGADVNAFSGQPFIIEVAKRYGIPEVLQILVDAGADLDVKDDHGKTALYYAERREDERFAQIIKDAQHERWLRIQNEKVEAKRKAQIIESLPPPIDEKEFKEELETIAQSGTAAEAAALLDHAFWSGIEVRVAWAHLRAVMPRRDKDLATLFIRWGAQPSSEALAALDKDEKEFLRRCGLRGVPLPRREKPAVKPQYPAEFKQAAAETSSFVHALLEKRRKAYVGRTMPDGTVYDGANAKGEHIYRTALPSPVHMSFNDAAKYVKNLNIHGHADWRLPHGGVLVPKGPVWAERAGVPPEEVKPLPEGVWEDTYARYVGCTMPDGSIYIGQGFPGGTHVYMAAEDAPELMDFKSASRYVKELNIHGHKDWGLPYGEYPGMAYRTISKKGAFSAEHVRNWLNENQGYWFLFQGEVVTEKEDGPWQKKDVPFVETHLQDGWFRKKGFEKKSAELKTARAAVRPVRKGPPPDEMLKKPSPPPHLRGQITRWT